MTHPIAPSRMLFVTTRLLIGLLLMATLNGCAALDRDTGKAPETATHDQSNTQGKSLRDQLNAGYSDLYSNVDGLSQVDKIFYVKLESDDVEKVVTEVTDYCGELAARMEGLTADYPALDIERKIDPPIIKAARDAQKKATLERFAPVVGDSGTAFERGLLIRLLGAMDQQRYMAATLAEREPDPGLSKIMANAADRFAGFYEDIDTLLKARFYR
ncbi:hypothetical protein [Salinisphaera sp. C84B14]|uniref:hypothetical protein n=1 Tax=Salinisphaera sp. C84B14 TaxID=1304155 RepID=UPI003342B4EB